MADQGSVSKKLSIYPQPDRETVLVKTNTKLEQNIAYARYAVAGAYRDIRGRLQSVLERWINVEHAVEHRLKSLKAPDEDLTPGAFYVGVAALTGSIIARNRSIPLRLTLPPTLFLISMNHFLPKSSHNISSYVSFLERAHAPALADAHEQLNQNIASGSAAASHTAHNIRVATTKGIESTLSGFQNWTGLKLMEFFGWESQIAHRVDEKTTKSRSDD